MLFRKKMRNSECEIIMASQTLNLPLATFNLPLKNAVTEVTAFFLLYFSNLNYIFISFKGFNNCIGDFVCNNKCVSKIAFSL